VAGTITTTHYGLGAQVRRLAFACTADAADGSFPDTVIPKIEGRLLALVTNPGATAPTALYDITLADVDGADRLQGVGANRSATATEQAPIVYTGTSVHPPVDADETLTLNIDNNTVNSATIDITIFYTPLAD
jgi:hypothetical protein